MPNPYAISTFLDAELGEAINHIVDATGFGSATFLIKEFMEKHKDDLIAFWNGQGKDGNTIYDKWLKKWSMTKAEQESIKAQKERDKHDKLVKQYVALAMEQPLAEELATQFPESDPFEVIKHRSYNIQNKPIEHEIAEKKRETPEYRELTKKKREAENFLGEIERGEHKIVTEEQKTKLKTDIAELDQKMKAFLEA